MESQTQVLNHKRPQGLETEVLLSCLDCQPANNDMEIYY